MIKEERALLSDLVLAFSESLDLISNQLVGHHRMVAYIALNIALELDIEDEEVKELIQAALFHDVGALSLKARLDALEFDMKYPHSHAEVGYCLMKINKSFDGIASAIRFHHLRWDEREIFHEICRDIPYISYIISLDDRVAVLLNDRNKVTSEKIKYIVDKIEDSRGKKFAPEVIDGFLKVSEKKSFWLDLLYGEPEILFKRILGDIFLDINELMSISKIFEKIIDFRSRFTATHSTGVSYVAVKLGKLYNMEPINLKKLSVAGRLHDIGKLSISNNILEKPGKLTKEEFEIMRSHALHTYSILGKIKGLEDIQRWAAFHHEKLNGTGYPFGKKADELSLGARIMAVADISTAILEDRPYRKGMKKDQVLKVLDRMVSEGEIDGDIVNLLKINYEEINEGRHFVQMKAIEEFNSFWNEVNDIAKIRLDAFNKKRFRPMSV